MACAWGASHEVGPRVCSRGRSPGYGSRRQRFTVMGKSGMGSTGSSKVQDVRFQIILGPGFSVDPKFSKMSLEPRIFGGSWK